MTMDSDRSNVFKNVEVSTIQVLKVLSQKGGSSKDLAALVNLSPRHVKRVLSSLRDDFRMNIIFKRTGKGRGSYVIYDWGIVDEKRFRELINDKV